MAPTLLDNILSDVRTQDMELIFVRFLHLLAHHPDFGQNQEALTDMAKYVPAIIPDPSSYGLHSRYVEFYIDLVGTEENISLLHHLAMKCKTVRDAESDSEVGRRLSDSCYIHLTTGSPALVHHERTRAGSTKSESEHAVMEHRHISRQSKIACRYIQGFAGFGCPE